MFAVSSPSDGPIEPARESPAIQRRSGSSGVSWRRVATVRGRVVVDSVERRAAALRWVSSLPGTVMTSARTRAAATAASTTKSPPTNAASRPNRPRREERSARRCDRGIRSMSAMRSSRCRMVRLLTGDPWYRSRDSGWCRRAGPQRRYGGSHPPRDPDRAGCGRGPRTGRRARAARHGCPVP